MSAYNHNLSLNLDNINLAAITDIGNEIDPCDMISLMFLLYEDPHLALRNLTVYLRVSDDIGGSTCNLLQDWASHAQTRSTWKAELLEALATCQLNTVIRKFGFDTSATRSCSRNSTETSYLHPMKKIFYMVCENLDYKSYEHFKNLINVYPNIPDHTICELFFLELMCCGYFSSVERGNKIGISDIEKLINALQKVPGCSKSQEMRSIFEKLYKIKDSIESPLKILTEKQNRDFCEKKYAHDFNDTFELFNQLSLDELKTDID